MYLLIHFQFFTRAAQHAAGIAVEQSHVVGGHDHCRALLRNFIQALDYLVAGFGVEIARGLVGEYQVGAVQKGARYHDALLLAAGELVGHFVAFVGHAHLGQHLVDALLAGGGFFPSRGTEHKLQIGIHIAIHKKLKILKHNAYLAAQHRHLLAAQRAQVIIKHTRLAGSRGHFGIQRFEQRALAGAHGAYEIHHLTGLNGETHVLEHHMLLAQQFYVFIFYY